MSLRAYLLAALVASGCGQRVVDGSFLGDATLRFSGLLTTDVGSPAHAAAGALWLGYEGLSEPTRGLETELLPVSAIGFPPIFTCDVLGAPPSVGNYLTADNLVVPVPMRLARLIILDDVDGNQAFTVDASGQLAAPDKLLAVAQRQALLYVAAPAAHPEALAGQILSDWKQADVGYQLVALDPAVALPDLSAHVIDPTARVLFDPPITPVVW